MAADGIPVAIDRRRYCHSREKREEGEEPVSEHHLNPGCVENDRADAGRDG